MHNIKLHFILAFAGALFLLPVFSYGASIDFYIDEAYENKTHELALYLFSSTYAHFYVEEEYFNSLPQDAKTTFRRNVENLSVQFDGFIYDRVRTVFGSEWTPGIDNDARLSIYFSDMPIAIDGYFRGLDETLTPNSNKREMIYINAKLATDVRLPAIVAHEFQHLINYNQKVRAGGFEEERWLNEGLSEYAATVAGYSEAGDYLRSRARAFLASPATSLTVWGNTGADFAVSSLFVHYLADQYGDKLIYYIAHSKNTGIAAINEALIQAGIPKNFTQIYAEWTAALFLNYDVDGTGVYSYKNPLLDFLTLHVSARTTLSLNEDNSVNTSVAMQDFSPQWYRFIPETLQENDSRSLILSFTTLDETDKFLMPVILTNLSGYVKVLFARVEAGEGSINIENFNKDLTSVVIVPASNTKLSDFDKGDNRFRIFSLAAKLSPTQVIQDGDLLRAEGKNEVYVVKKFTENSDASYRRWLRTPEVFNFYGHLNWQAIRAVDPIQLNSFHESVLIRRAGDYKVYEIDNNGYKHWLNITARQFEAAGRKWDAVFEVNEKEFNWLKTGANLTV